MSDLKSLKKTRLGYERLIRADIQRLEGAMQIGNYATAKHALVDIEAAVSKLRLMTEMYMEG